MAKEIKCPRCGGNWGYYTKSIQRLTQFTDFNGEAIDANHDWISGGEQKYCGQCDKRITITDPIDNPQT